MGRGKAVSGQLAGAENSSGRVPPRGNGPWYPAQGGRHVHLGLEPSWSSKGFHPQENAFPTTTNQECSWRVVASDVFQVGNNHLLYCGRASFLLQESLCLAVQLFLCQEKSEVVTLFQILSLNSSEKKAQFGTASSTHNIAAVYSWYWIQ